jgi:hypothetical protein
MRDKHTAPRPESSRPDKDDEQVDRSLIEWMLSLTPRQRLDVLEGHRRLIRTLRRDPVRP